MRGDPFEDTSITKSPRGLVRAAGASLVGALLLFVCAWDLIVIPRLAGEECRVVGRTAETIGVEEGTAVQPDSGGCAAFRCVDIVRTASRIAWPDLEDIESVRSPGC